MLKTNHTHLLINVNYLSSLDNWNGITVMQHKENIGEVFKIIRHQIQHTISTPKYQFQNTISNPTLKQLLGNRANVYSMQYQTFSSFI